MPLALVYILAAVLFLILLIFLGFQPKFIARITGGILAFVAVSGILLYGYGYYTLYHNIPQAAVRTLFSVFCMFLGRNEIGAISQAPLLGKPIAQLYIYLVHLLALYFTASALINTIGAGLLRKLNLLFLHRGSLNLIYGVSEETIAFASRLQNKKNPVIVFVDGNAGSYETRILRLGGILLSDEAATQPAPALLGKIGLKPGRRHVDLYCLSDSPADNYRYASACKEIFAAAGIPAEQTSLTVILEDELLGAQLQADENGRAGFGTVQAVDRYDLLARLMVRSCPLYRTMTFDSEGRAEENFEALIVGFGRRGKAILRRLVMNGQYAGSRFHVTVIAKDPREQSGSIFYRCPGLKENYAIDFLNASAQSADAYQFLKDYASRLNYVVICMGDEKKNLEIGNEYLEVLDDCRSRTPILLCSGSAVTRLTREEGCVEEAELFSPELLSSRELDRMAMLLNHKYHEQEGRTAEEDWRRCDYFSRMSCRASADYADTFMAAAGTTREAVLKDGWQPSGALLENLAEMEHLRWNAFHFAMGYRRMPQETMEKRREQFRAERAKYGKSSVRITKDTAAKQHACLVSWEELDALSAWESEAAGKSLDYKQMDRSNVLMIPELLKQEEAMARG